MRKWECRTIRFIPSLSSDLDNLNALGDQGWEVVGVLSQLSVSGGDGGIGRNYRYETVGYISPIKSSQSHHILLKRARIDGHQQG
jgi:hypothetical protein